MKKILALFTLLLLTACNPVKEDFLKSVPNPDDAHYLHEIQREKADIVLYQDNDGLHLAYKKYAGKEWMFTSSLDFDMQDGFSWTMNNMPPLRVVLFAGLITDDEMTKVVVKQKTLQKEATIFQTDDGQRVWFATFDTLEDGDKNGPDPLKIEVLNDSDKLLWKSGIYEDGLYEGKVND